MWPLFPPIPSLIAAGGYVIAGSALFDGGYLTFNQGVPTSAGVYTASLAFKVAGLSYQDACFYTLLDGNVDASANPADNAEHIGFNASGQLQHIAGNLKAATRGVGGNNYSTALFRDPAAWAHLLIVSNGATKTYYVNGTEVSMTTATAFAAATFINNGGGGDDVVVGGFGVGETGFYVTTNRAKVHIAEAILLDGYTASPSDFLETTADGYVSLIDPSALVAANKGANGWRLTGGTDIAAGTDSSGNGNDFTPSGTITAVNDSPTDSVANGYGDFWTFDPNSNINDGKAALSNGNRSYAYSGAQNGEVFGTLSVDADNDTGTYVFTATINRGGTNAAVFGLCAHGDVSANVLSKSNEIGYNGANDTFYINGVAQTAVTGADEVRIEVDFSTTTNNVQLFTGGVSRATYSWASTGRVAPFAARATGSATCTLIADVASMAGTVTAGYAPLATQTLPAPAVADARLSFQTVLDTGANIKAACDAVFGGDYLAVVKDRANVNNWQWWNTVRGIAAITHSNDADAETTYAAPTGNSVGYVFKAGASSSANTDGTIASTVSVAAHGGHSIVEITGTGANGTVGHGLFSAPKFIIGKRADGTGSWVCYHVGLTSAAYYIALSASDAQVSDATQWQGVAPTSTVFSLGTGGALNTNGSTVIFYCFAEVPGFIKIGSYTGNGSADGPMIDCGFAPALVLARSTSGPRQWGLIDRARDTYNLAATRLQVNNTSAENYNTGEAFDLLSNGFKCRSAGSTFNASGETYIYLAIADGCGAIQGAGAGTAQGRAR